ncbi:MAG: DHA2 family efflux MFS transporter permease subunit [Pseudonocardiaceae bacterium]|nr:DHA2 family efflux MFS transporter permease subunit [Pseudonocardiaceae bacterium]
MGAIMSILSTTSVNVALSTLSRELDAPISHIQWVVTAYLLALATVIPVTGWAAERFGIRRLWLSTGAVFVGASVLCGMAWSANSLIAFRVIQGFAGGMIMPLGMMVLTLAVGPARVGRAMSVIGVPMLLGPTFGPVLGGLLVQYVGWQWIFYMNVPVGLAGLALAWRLLPADRPEGRHRLDWVGLLLASPGIALLTFGLAEVPGQGGVAHPVVYVPLLAGATLLAVFIWHARRTDDPLIDVRLFASLRLAAASATTFLLGLALFGSLLVLPLYFQIVHGEGALATGLLLIPQGLASAAVMPLVGPLTDRFGGGRVVLVGVMLLALGTAVLTQVGADTPYPLLLAALAVRGLGLGASMMPAMAAAYAAMRPETVPRATSGLNVMQRVGGSIGAAVLAVILNVQIAAALPGAGTAARGAVPAGDLGPLADAVAGAFGVTFWWAFWLTLAAIPAALVLARQERHARDREAVQRAREVAAHQPA